MEQLIQAALAKYSADRIGKFDFALENVGGVVVQDKCSETFSPSLARVSLFGFGLFHVTSSPRAIIQVREERELINELSKPPQCCCVFMWFVELLHSSTKFILEIAGHLKEMQVMRWSRYVFAGVHLETVMTSYMYQLLQLLILQLKGEIIITGVTLEHIPRELTPDGSFNSAPKDFSVWVCSITCILVWWFIIVGRAWASSKLICHCTKQDLSCISRYLDK